MPVDSFSRVADSLKGALAAAKPLDILRPAVGIVGFLAALGGAVGLVLPVAKAARRLGRWKRYRWDQKPLTMFPADYRYKPDVFVNRGDRGEERLRKALAETSGSILIRGPSGVGKSSVLVWLLRKNGIGAYMPTDDDLAHHDMLRTDRSVIVLDNLSDLKRRNRDGDVTYWLQKNQPRVIGLVPDEAYEETRSLLGQFASEARIEPWSETEGRSLADAYGTVFSKADFQNTALSVVAPMSSMRRLYERQSDEDGRAVLDTLKILKNLTESYVPRQVVTLYAERFCKAAPGRGESALRTVEPKWCRVKDESVMLRDGFEPAISMYFSWDSGAWENLLCILRDKPHKDWHEVAGRMAEQMEVSGRWKEALTVAERCLEAGCVDPRMLAMRAVLLHDLGRTDEATTAYEDALARFREAHDKAGAAAVTHNLAMVYQGQGDYAKAKKLYEESLADAKERGNESGIAATLHELGRLAQNQGDYAEARKLYDRALAMSRELGNKSGIAAALRGLGDVALVQGNYPDAGKLYDKSHAIASELNDKVGIGSCLYARGNLAYVQGDFASARALYDESLAIATELDDKYRMGESLLALGGVDIFEGHYAAAGKRTTQSLALLREIDRRPGVAICLMQLGIIALRTHDHLNAQRYLAESIELSRVLGDKSCYAKTLHQLGILAQHQGRHREAMEFYTQSLKLEEGLGDKLSCATTTAQLGQLAVAEGDDRTALRYYLNALAIFEELKSPYRDLAMQDIDEMRHRLGVEAFKKLSDEVVAGLKKPTASS
jgi:tetratricopeptide (TPR) repeat protein